MQEVLKIEDLDFDKTYSYAEYLTWKFKERVELLKGKLFKMSPSPNRFHQEFSGNLFFEFKKYLRRKPCKVFTAPFDVRLPKTSNADDRQILTVVQPDITVICDLKKLDRKGCLGAPDLVVEILSPATSERDAKDKFELYEQVGVREYWIVHPEEQTLLIFTLQKDGKYTGSRLFTRSDKVKVGIFEDLIIDMSEVFEQFDEYES